MTTAKKGKQGFASMSPDLVKAIASKGGRHAWKLGLAHKWTPAEASAAGRKGGRISKRGLGKKTLALRSEP